MHVCLFLNHACNLRCRYCYNGEHFARPMSAEVARAGVELGFASGPPGRPVLISFFGGEPLLELARMAQAIAHAETLAAQTGRLLSFELVTNGTLLDGERLALLRRHRVYLGVSVDGTAAAHDACRVRADGQGSHAAVWRNLQAVLATAPELPVKTLTVIDPANVDQLAASFDALLELGVRQLSFNLNYQADWGDAARARFTAALAALGERYVAAHRRGTPFALSMLDAKVVTHLQGGYAGGDRCDFGCQEIAVAPSGRLYPCDRLVGQDDGDDVVIGDVFGGIDVARRDALIAAKNTIPEDCQSCELQGRCMHWCGCVNRALTGQVGAVDGLLCWFEQQLIETADRCAEQLYAERAPGFLRRFGLN